MTPYRSEPRSHRRSVAQPWYVSVIVLAGAFAMCAAPGFAGEPAVVLDDRGRPTGVSNLEIRGTTYDVDFVWGSFSELFDLDIPSNTPAFWGAPETALNAVDLYGDLLDISARGWPAQVFDNGMNSTKTFTPVELGVDQAVRGVVHFWGAEWYGSPETCEGLPALWFTCAPGESPKFMYATYSVVPEPTGSPFVTAISLLVAARAWYASRRPCKHWCTFSRD